MSPTKMVRRLVRVMSSSTWLCVLGSRRIRLIYLWPELRLRWRGPADHDRLVVIGDDLAAHGPFGRGPAGGVGAGPGQNVRGRGDAPVRQHARGLDDPLIAVPGPKRVAVTPVGIEDPRLDLLGQGVPADPLRHVHDGLALDVNHEVAEQEVLVVRPATGRVNDRIRAFVEPFAEHPFQLLEPLVVGKAGRVLFADAGMQPSPPLLHIENRVVAKVAGSPPLGLTRVWPSSLATSGPRKRSDASEDLDRGPFPLVEECGIEVLDRGTALDSFAVFVDQFGVIGVEGRHRLGVAGVERAGERLGDLLDGLFILGPMRWKGLRPGPSGRHPRLRPPDRRHGLSANRCRHLGHRARHDAQTQPDKHGSRHRDFEIRFVSWWCTHVVV